MCGIGGFSGEFDRELLGRMSARMAHRGPDDAGAWSAQEDEIGLCHRRLSIIDLSPAGHQPMPDAQERARIVFNGEIYNYRELRAELEESGYAFASHTDTEVVLNLYLAYGEAMLARLEGMFAFAIWDVGRRELFLARDGFGVKPLYYAFTPRGFLFASELKGLLEEASVPRDIDPQAVANYLTYLWCPAPRTMLRAVSKLLPGEAMVVRQGRLLRRWRFYDLPYGQGRFQGSRGEAAEELRRLLAASVKRQMVADVPVGAFLSGGLDSSAICFFAREHARGGELDCFTIAFKDDAWRREGMADDLPYARRVAQALGVRLHTVEVGPEMAAEFERMVYHLDEPQADPAALNVLFIARLARARGVPVLLSGVGGDDLFSGYRRHAALWLERYWTWMPRPALRTVAGAARGLSRANPAARRLSKLLANADRDVSGRIEGYFTWIDPSARTALLSPELREALREGEGGNPLMESLSTLPSGLAPLDQMLYLEGHHFLADHNLNYADKMSMAASVEMRVPFLDKELVAFATSLPPAYKQHRLEGKWLFKKAMGPLLPREVIHRPKSGFGAPVRHWLKHELRPLVKEYLAEEVVMRRGLFDPAGIQQFLGDDEACRVDGAYPILAMILIEMWCRAFLDNWPRERVA
jgi:asparagine synthase (glutamine-hydrolysing)